MKGRSTLFVVATLSNMEHWSIYQKDSVLQIRMIRIRLLSQADDRKSILKAILKDLRSSIEPDNARSKISSLKSNGISAEQNFANHASNHKFRRVTEKSEGSLEMAQIYQ